MKEDWNLRKNNESGHWPISHEANYVEPMQIMMIGASIGTSKVNTHLFEEKVKQALEEFEK